MLADKSLTRRIGKRVYDLYYNGPKLHMVVLNTPKARYWVINTLLDSDSTSARATGSRGQSGPESFSHQPWSSLGSMRIVSA